MEEIEIWKDVPGYLGLYQASSFGRIKSLINNGKILHQFLNKATGYLHLCLYQNKKSTTITVHRVIALAFHKKGKFNHVNHKDCNKINNRSDNLEWGTRSHNQKHAFDNGRIKVPDIKGEDNWNAKFTENDIRKIRLSKLGNVPLGKKYSVASNTIRAIRVFKTWRHVK